jgi:hypothetical protein
MKTISSTFVLLALLVAACGEPDLHEPRESEDGRLVAKLVSVEWMGQAAGAVGSSPFPGVRPANLFWIEAKLELENVSDQPATLADSFHVGRREGQKGASIRAYRLSNDTEGPFGDGTIAAGERVVLLLRSSLQERPSYTIFQPLEIRHGTEDWRWPVPDVPTFEAFFAESIRSGCALSLSGKILEQGWNVLPAGTEVDAPAGARKITDDLLFLEITLEVRNRAEGPVDFHPPLELRRFGERLAPLRPDPNHHTRAQWEKLARGIPAGETRTLRLATNGMTREKFEGSGELHVVHPLCEWRLEVEAPPPWDEIPRTGKKGE